MRQQNATAPVETTGFFGKYYLGHWKKLFGFCCLIIAVYFGYIGYLETRVNTPFDDTKMVQNAGLNDRERYWGTYRSGMYFGLKTRDPHSIVMGLMWYFPQKLKQGGEGIRHWCESGDNLDQYGWLQHDGKSFGVQKLKDGTFELETSFVKFPGGQYGGDWTARVTVNSSDRFYNQVSEQYCIRNMIQKVDHFYQKLINYKIFIKKFSKHLKM